MPRPGLVLAFSVLCSILCPAGADDFFGYLGDDTAELYRGSSFWAAMGGTGLTVLSMELEDGNGYPGILGDDGIFHSAGEFTDAAFGLPMLGASSLLWLGGELADHHGTAETGQMLTEGLLISGGITGGLKLLTGRERPDGSDPLSFPSFHTAGTVCSAVILWDRYGAGAGIPAGCWRCSQVYPGSTLACTTHLTCFWGATVGIVTGLAVSRAHGVESGDGTDGFHLGWDSALGITIGF